jgi:GrpB-like predicted nucleotidyltransferase (UPF0157 family)
MCQELQIVPYDPAWPSEFEAEAVLIREALGFLAVRIEQHGSTSIPGLAAKPIIDIQVSVESLQLISAFHDPLWSIGYVHVPHADDSFRPFFHRPSTFSMSHLGTFRDRSSPPATLVMPDLYSASFPP